MTAKESIQHWHEGALRAFKAAQDLLATENYEMALFACHLAVEKQLKALSIQKHDANPPRTHNLVELCTNAGLTLSQEDLLDLRELGSFSAFGRYGSEEWIEADATHTNVLHWIARTEYFLSLFAI